LGKCPLVQ